MGGSGQRLNALLNVHSYYSLGAGTASPTTLVERAAELGYEYLALTDDLNVTGAVELFQAARKHGVRALIGATVPVRLENDVYPFVLIAPTRATAIAQHARIWGVPRCLHGARGRRQRLGPWAQAYSHHHQQREHATDREGDDRVTNGLGACGHSAMLRARA